jgi:hypothetical protein
VWFGVWHWLILHNLWQSVISWAVFTALNGFWALRLWKKHRHAQADIQDKLDTDTPGGLGEIAKLLKDKEDGEPGAGHR